MQLDARTSCWLSFLWLVDVWWDVFGVSVGLVDCVRSARATLFSALFWCRLPFELVVSLIVAAGLQRYAAFAISAYFLE